MTWWAFLSVWTDPDGVAGNQSATARPPAPGDFAACGHAASPVAISKTGRADDVTAELAGRPTLG
jgi:hypothetical protein